MQLHRLALKDLRADEYLVTIVRHHWWVLLKSVFGVFIIFLLPFIAVPLLGFYLTQSGVAVATAGAMSGFFGSLWALICWQLLFVRWTDYYYDVWIITNWRIIDIDQIGLFRRNTASIMDLSHIQDMDTELNGIIGNLLNFGHINVQTAGTRNEFDIDDVGNPTKVEAMIREAQAKLLHHPPAAGAVATQHDG